MKNFTFAAIALSLLSFVASQPHGKEGLHVEIRHHSLHSQRYRHVHPQADVTDYVTVTLPEVVVSVDDQGNTVSIETRTPAATTSTPAPAPPSSILRTVTEPIQSASQPAVDTQGAVHQTQGSGFGITWLPYNADGSCKSQDQADSDFAQLAGAGFSTVRIYGVDCNQVAMTIAAVEQYNMAIFAGLIDLSDLAANLASMITQVGSHWNMIDTVSIGNELVNDGLATVADVVAALGTARGILNSAGFVGPIVTVDVFEQFIGNTELCDASDYCAANCQAYFDNQVSSDQAGDYVSGIFGQIGQSNPGKEVVITESGWPWAGAPNGAALPSVNDQQAAIGSLRSAFAANPGSLVLYDSFDALWKQPGPYGVEQYFGIYDH